MGDKQNIVKAIGGRLRTILEMVPADTFQRLEEIRIRQGRPLILKGAQGEIFISGRGLPTEEENAFCPDAKDIQDALELLSGYSLYAFEQELRQGFITIEGGHRVGVTGRAVMEKGNIKTLKNINGLLIRISHEITGCGKELVPFLMKDGRLCHTLILSPPGCGKTTLLRDIIRTLSTEYGQTVAVVDERSEIAGCYQGKPQNDVGIRTDILECCPKAEGMLMLLRSMAPQIIAVDEIGRNEDISALEDIISAGVRVICTVHGSSLSELQQRPALKALLDKRIMERFIVLSHTNGAGSLEGIYDSAFSSIKKASPPQTVNKPHISGVQQA